jgi:hypothetical protein
VGGVVHPRDDGDADVAQGSSGLVALKGGGVSERLCSSSADGRLDRVRSLVDADVVGERLTLRCRRRERPSADRGAVRPGSGRNGHLG